MRERTTPFVLLGVIAQMGAASGYEVQRFIAGSIGQFWSESFGQIYPELSRLAREGLVSEVSERQNGARSRTRYRVTPQGRAGLKRWLARPPVEQPPRQEALLKVFFGSIAGADVVLGHLDQEEKRHRERLGFLRGVAETLLRDFPDDPDLAFSLMTVRAGERGALSRLAWTAECRALLAAHEKGPRAVAAAWKRLSSVASAT